MENISEELYNHIHKILLQLSEDIGKILVDHIQKEIVRQNLISNYDLYNSIAYQVNEIYNEIVLSVFSSVPYAIYINKGTKAKMPPVQNIIEWIMAKKESVGFTILNDTVENVAWAIAKSISKKGISARRFFDLGIESALPEIEKRIGEIKI